MAEKKTAGQRLDHAIERTKHHAKRSKDYCKEKFAGQKAMTILLVLAGVALVIFLVWWIATIPAEKSTTEDAQSIAKMLKAQGVAIQGIEVTRGGYEVTYAAESAVDRFDDALLYDWAMIYGVAAAHRCDEVSIKTTLDGEELHKQTASCPAVRALVRGVLTEQEFWALVEHESLV